MDAMDTRDDLRKRSSSRLILATVCPRDEAGAQFAQHDRAEDDLSTF